MFFGSFLVAIILTTCSKAGLAFKFIQRPLSLLSHCSIESNSSQEYGPDNFGDIMGGCETIVSVDGAFNPMERIVLTANGNLQRIMSAYYAAKVTVKVLECDRVGGNLFSRKVDLCVKNKVFCTATGQVDVSDDCVAAVEGKMVGIGQLFRYLGVLPSFQLLSAGHDENGCLYREYELSCPQVRCKFRETFVPGFLEL